MSVTTGNGEAEISLTNLITKISTEDIVYLKKECERLNDSVIIFDRCGTLFQDRSMNTFHNVVSYLSIFFFSKKVIEEWHSDSFEQFFRENDHYPHIEGELFENLAHVKNGSLEIFLVQEIGCLLEGVLEKHLTEFYRSTRERTNEAKCYASWVIYNCRGDILKRYYCDEVVYDMTS